MNGSLQQNIQPGTYYAIQRNWKAGDSIRIALDMRGRIMSAGEKNEYLAIVRGPVVLARDARLGGPADAMPVNIVSKDGYVDLQLVQHPQNNIWMQFSATFMPESYKEGPAVPQQLILCDYASAGNTNDESSRFRVWMPKLMDPMKLR